MKVQREWQAARQDIPSQEQQSRAETRAPQPRDPEEKMGRHLTIKLLRLDRPVAEKRLQQAVENEEREARPSKLLGIERDNAGRLKLKEIKRQAARQDVPNQEQQTRAETRATQTIDPEEKMGRHLTVKLHRLHRPVAKNGQQSVVEKEERVAIPNKLLSIDRDIARRYKLKKIKKKDVKERREWRNQEKRDTYKKNKEKYNKAKREKRLKSKVKGKNKAGKRRAKSGSSESKE